MDAPAPAAVDPWVELSVPAEVVGAAVRFATTGSGPAAALTAAPEHPDPENAEAGRASAARAHPAGRGPRTSPRTRHWCLRWPADPAHEITSSSSGR